VSGSDYDSEPVSGVDDAAGRRQPLAALWTARGRGAVATIRLWADVRRWGGIELLPFKAANGKPLRDQPTGRVVFGRWGTDAVEEVVVCLVDEQTLEIHCHGGEAAASRILADCAQAECRVVTWNEMVRIAQGVLEAELLEALSQATTLRTAEIVLEQSNGLLRAELESIAQESNVEPLRARIGALLRWADFGEHLTRPWKVVLAGRPNVGKSSLINSLLGYTRSIVFDQPGTTRDVVTATTAIDGWPIEFSDTAGLREGSEPLEAAGIERARGALADADLAVVLIDISQPASDEDRAILAAFPTAIVVAHKCDLPPWQGPQAWNAEATHWMPVSSKTGEGVEALLRKISTRLVPDIPPAATALPVTERQATLLGRALEAAERNDLEGGRQLIQAILA
jgi:tRNA modification GTPase